MMSKTVFFDLLPRSPNSQLTSVTKPSGKTFAVLDRFCLLDALKPIRLNLYLFYHFRVYA
ncbi:hypothetical protein SAMN04488041_11911 [Sulfitobacter pontiacus]|uniref:Uncharacterized protein n=1 Tax=Sulfitobacter pontiacus TaxID=60137 RepID=A0A1H3EEU0_9RHOB|nr:hypothetical protein SAMN04488041_11911 [Sulfitobacter pontiacus]